MQKRVNEDALSGGIGLGLHLVNDLVNELNGRLDYESELGVGTSFYIYLPVEFTEAEPEFNIEQINNQPLPLRLLIVDDDVLNLELLELSLASKVSLLKSHPTAEEALENFNPGEFDIVLTDYRLPGMSGAEMVKIMNRMDSACTFYLMTAAVAEKDAHELLQGAFTYLFEKPFDPAEFYDCLQEELLARQTANLLDYSEILPYLEGEKENLAAYLLKYKLTLQVQLDALESALAIADLEQLHGIFHQLGSRFGLLKLNIVPLIRTLEHQAENKQWSWREKAQTKRLLRICRAFLANWT